jgi:hypothetical protein
MGRRLIKHSDTGFFQNDFTLPPYPEIGIWTARAFYDGQLNFFGACLLLPKNNIV